MADTPFIHNYSTGRTYYGPSLEDPSYQYPFWTGREPESAYKGDYPLTKLVAASALAIGGIVGSARIPYKEGRLGDAYIGFLRGAEEYSPGGILRTFQLSNFFSQWESIPGGELTISAQELIDNKAYRNYLTRLIGETEGKRATDGRLIREGVKLKGGKLYFGAGDVALEYASALRTPEDVSARLQSGLARHLGVTPTSQSGAISPAHQFFSRTAPFGDETAARNPTIAGMPAQIIGGKNLPQYMYRQGAMWGTEMVDRFNRLLKAPFEMQPFKTVFGGMQEGLQKLTGRKLEFAVAEGPALQMLGKLSWKYGAGLGAIAVGYQTVDYMFRNSSLLDKTLFSEGLTYGAATLGVKANIMASRAAELTGLHAYREKQEEMAPGSTSLQKLSAFPLIGAFSTGIAAYGVEVAKMAHLQWTQGLDAPAARKLVTEQMESFSGTGALARLGQAITKTSGLYARQDRLGRFMQKIATPDKAGDLTFKLLGKVGPVKLAGLVGATAGAALTLPFLPGALVPSERPDDLRAKYTGEKEIAVRKGRWWEFGRSPYEGSRVMYYRPHWYARMKMRARDKGVYGEEEGEMHPLEKRWKREFTYELEAKHFADRPYPVTALPFEDIPLIGPLLANTIGKIIKPPKLMHTEEWARGGETIVNQPGFGRRIATEMGELGPQMPITPYGIEGAVGEQAYRFTEMIGLPGFALTSLKEELTGTSDFFDQSAQLESARRMFGAERAYWDAEIGGGLGTTEALRRLYPHRRRQIQQYNPIRNTMPEWLPGAGERGPDLLHGDPFVKVQEGELRLPGAGYEARFPELKGIKPEDYPLIHKYRILADVAPYTDKFDETNRAVSAARANTKTWTDYEENLYQVTKEQLKAKKEKKVFNDYQYLSPSGNVSDKSRFYADESSSVMATLNKMKSEQRENEKGGVFQKFFGGYWEMLSHNAETAIDQLTPVSPGAKLVHQRTPVESYEREQLYGTQNAFWQNPVRDFIRPFANLVGHSLGYKGVPDDIQQKRNLEQYFDTLEYVKFSRLSNMARMAGDSNAVTEFEALKDQTTFGVNPFTRNYTSIFRGLSSSSRDYYNAFAEAETTEERARILEIVPDNEKALYIARWKQKYVDDVKQAEKMGLLSEDQLSEAAEQIDSIYNESRSEGMPVDKELWADYVSSRIQGENYADWYRRTKLLANVNLPPPDWVGWHPSVDLEDIKLKVVQNLGEDMHDYDLWADRANAMADKPYITDDVTDAILDPPQLEGQALRSRINELFLANEMRAKIYSTSSYLGRKDTINMDISETRDFGGILEELD